MILVKQKQQIPVKDLTIKQGLLNNDSWQFDVKCFDCFFAGRLINSV